jgi:cell division septal protein FtsQ
MSQSEEDQKISQFTESRRLQQNQLERQVRKSQMRLKRFRFIARYVAIAILVAFGYMLLKSPQWYLNKDVFNSVENPSLEILNNKIVPSYKILAALRRSEIPNTPMYNFDTDEIKHNILQLEPVEAVFIRRFWFPARLQVIIQERVPVITISPTENVAPIAFFAKGGKLIGRDYMPLDKAFKTVLVLSYGVRGDDYRNWDNSKIKLIENVAKAVKEASGEEVQYIDFRTPRDIYVKVKTANIRLGELDDTVFDRIKRIPSILPQVKMLDKKIKYVDLRWKDANYIKLD